MALIRIVVLAYVADDEDDPENVAEQLCEEIHALTTKVSGIDGIDAEDCEVADV